MKGFVHDIQELAIANTYFRRVVFTAMHCQVVLMSLKPGEEIGPETHKLDQFFRIEQGTGEAMLDDVRTTIGPGFGVLVPSGVHHNITNVGSEALHMSVIYSPPKQVDGRVHATRAESEADNDRFDGEATAKGT